MKPQFTFDQLMRQAFAIAGMQELAQHLGIRYQAMYSWMQYGHLPRTCWTGEKNYAYEIEKLTGGEVLAADLMAFKPKIKLGTG